jgi:putative hemolysin
MDVPPTLGLMAVLVLVLANGFFVATEFAIVAVRRSRLEELAQQGRVGAAAALAVVAHLDAYIAATQFGITLASLALGWVGEPALAHLVEPTFAVVLGTFAPAAAHGVAIGVAFAVITALHIVLGELAPKGLALQKPESTTLWVARPIQLFHALFKWPITALNAIGNGTLRIFGLAAASGHEMVHSVEELRLLVTGMQKAGVVDRSEARIAHRAFAFGELTASALMTPRTEVEAVSITTTINDLLKLAKTTPHSRLPVFEHSLDNILGILYVRELFKYCNTSADGFALKSLMQPPLIVPETNYATDLLEEMRTARCQIAVVVDEYGGTAGIVTLMDLLESLVGPVEDGPRADAATVTDGHVEADGSVLLDGLMRVEEFEETANMRLDDQSREEVDTLGGLIVAMLGRVPKVGDEVTIGVRRLRVEALDGLRVATLRVFPNPDSSPASVRSSGTVQG